MVDLKFRASKVFHSGRQAADSLICYLCLGLIRLKKLSQDERQRELTEELK